MGTVAAEPQRAIHNGVVLGTVSLIRIRAHRVCLVPAYSVFLGLWISSLLASPVGWRGVLRPGGCRRELDSRISAWRDTRVLWPVSVFQLLSVLDENTTSNATKNGHWEEIVHMYSPWDSLRPSYELSKCLYYSTKYRSPLHRHWNSKPWCPRSHFAPARSSIPRRGFFNTSPLSPRSGPHNFPIELTPSNVLQSVRGCIVLQITCDVGLNSGLKQPCISPFSSTFRPLCIFSAISSFKEKLPTCCGSGCGCSRCDQFFGPKLTTSKICYSKSCFN